jgi:hypothetical protein
MFNTYKYVMPHRPKRTECGTSSELGKNILARNLERRLEHRPAVKLLGRFQQACPIVAVTMMRKLRQ